jgi:hypothetical protein
MGLPSYQRARQRAITAFEEDRDLVMRVLAEFREMPGLKLSLPQAARLFGVEAARCERTLGRLVQSGMLATDGRVFVRPNGIVRQPDRL